MIEIVPKAALSAVMLLATMGCATAPTPDEIERADVGPLPDYDVGRDASESLLRARVSEREPHRYESDRWRQVDLELAEIHWDAAFRRGWYEVGSSITFAWQLSASVNARNEKGELTGPEPWSFWIRYGTLVAIAVPSRMGKAGAAKELSSPIPLRRAAETSSIDAR